MRCCLPSLRPAAFPPPSPPPISVGFVRCFNGTTQPSDSSSVPRQLRLLDFLSRPGIAQATAGQTRSPRFRRDPFVRDVASDPGRATVPRVTAPHMLPSAIATASAPATSRIYRGRNADCSTPPAQIRAGPTKALGSYLECMTRNRWSGHGCCTRTGGKNRSMSRLIRAHVSRCRWLRRRRLRNHCSLMWARNDDSM
jgi:hypothetical protein